MTYFIPAANFADIMKLENSGSGLTGSNIIIKDGLGTSSKLALSTAGGDFTGNWTFAAGASLTFDAADTLNVSSIASSGAATDIDLTLTGKGTGQVLFGDASTAGSIQAEANFSLTVAGGDSDGSATAGDLNLAAGDGASSFASGDVNIYGGSTSGGGAKGMVNIQYQETIDAFTNVAVFDGVSSAVNYFTVLNSATGTDIEIQATGSDTDIDMLLLPKGEGRILVGSSGDGAIQSSVNSELIILGGDSDGTAVGGDLSIGGGAGASSFDSGDVNIYGGSTSGGGAKGVVNIQYQASPNSQTNVAVFDGVSSAVNYFTIVSSAAGNAVEIQATGTDSNIDMKLTPKGTGVISVPSGTYEDNVTADDDIPNKKYIDDTFSTITRTNNDQTDSYTLVLGDAGNLIIMNKGTANVLTIPINSSVAFAVGTQIDVIMFGAGTTSITAASSVTLNGASAGSGEMSAQYGAVTIIKQATDVWIVSGSIGTVA